LSVIVKIKEKIFIKKLNIFDIESKIFDAFNEVEDPREITKDISL
jgi:hypothetical protein